MVLCAFVTLEQIAIALLVRRGVQRTGKCSERIEERLEALPVVGFRVICEAGIGHQTKVIA
jgi:hypothetical protein